MFPITVEIKNYRCFSDEYPLRIVIDKGFTAFVGPNNAGKSSCLKFFHELRNLWGDLATNLALRVGKQQPVGIQYLDITDPTELFYRYNDRPISFSIEVTVSDEHSLDGQLDLIQITGRCARNDPTVWKLVGSTRNGQRVGSTPIASHEPYKFALEGQAAVNATTMFRAMDVLYRVLYVPPFRNTINTPGGTEYQLLMGSEFVKTWDNWKNGGKLTNAERIGNVTKDIQSLFGFHQMEINADTEKQRLNIVIDGYPFKLYEQGSGIQEFIVVFGNVAIKMPSFVLIDEPELHLHPSLQLNFLTYLGRYTQHGVLFATHSIGLARSASTKVFGFTKGGRNSVVHRFGDPRNYSELLGELNFAAHRDMGYETLLLLEGPNDVTALMEILRTMGKDHKVVTMPLGGREMIHPKREPEVAEIRRLAERIFALLDSERGAAGDPIQPEIAGFAAVCEKHGIKTHITDRRAVENYFTARAVRAAFGNGVSPLDEFENTKGLKSFWGKSDNWRVASHMTLEEIMQTDVGKFLSEI